MKNILKYWRKISDTIKLGGCSGDGKTRQAATRVYQLIFLGKPTDITIKFYYDDRLDYGKMDICPIGENALKYMIKGEYNEKEIAGKIRESRIVENDA